MITSIITIKILALALTIILTALVALALKKQQYFKIIAILGIILLPFTITVPNNSSPQLTAEQQELAIAEYTSFSKWYSNYLKQIDKIDAFNKDYNTLHEMLKNDEISFQYATVKLQDLLHNIENFNTELLKLAPPPNLSDKNQVLVQNIITKTINFSNQQLQLIQKSLEILNSKNTAPKKHEEVILEFNKASILEAPFSLNILGDLALIKQNIHTTPQPTATEPTKL